MVKKHVLPCIISKLLEAEIPVEQVETVASACRSILVSEQVYRRWRK